MREEKKNSKNSTDNKKTKSGKNPIKAEKKNSQPNRGKISVWQDNHTEKRQKNSKSPKKSKGAECKAVAQRRLFKKT